MRYRHALAFAIALLTLPALAAAQSNRLVRVPQDGTLATAIGRVADGGIIEIAGGTYASPGQGFTISGAAARKTFTIRSVTGATVVLDGGGSRPVLKLTGSNGSRGKQVTFVGLIFRNGRATGNNTAGGVTVSGAATAVFRNCAFENNREEAAATGGGGTKVFGGATATFINSRWQGNRSDLRGGGLVVRDATVSIQGGSFTDNRTNHPQHRLNAAGGGIAVLGGTLNVSGTRFERNEAGWTGGAIYAIGVWNGRQATLNVTNSSFLDNQAVADPCCVNRDVTTGGAIHVEDLTTLTVNGSLFLRNRADLGGAIDNFRSIVEVNNSVFRGNQSTRTRPERGVGGAIALMSVDSVDASTNNGTANRRSARLTLTRSLLQGGAEVERPSYAGGCLFASGDSARQFGEGVPQMGTADENRAHVVVRNVVFFDCDVATTPDDDAFGGAILNDFVDLTLEDSMVLDSDARGDGAGGGGLMIRQESSAKITRTTFAGNTALRWGGAAFARGSNLEVRDSRFYGNQVSPGVSEPLNESRGAAVFIIPFTGATRPRGVTGFIANSVFSENSGLHLWDLEPNDGPANPIQYTGNRFTTTSFGDRIFFNSRVALGGGTVADLNASAKGDGNTQVANLREGALLAVPSPDAVGAGAAAPTESTLAYAWTGRNAALAGNSLASRTGLLEVPPGSYTLTVEGTGVASVQAASSCTAGSSLCLNGNRFVAEVTWRTADASGSGQAVSLTGDTGYFWFFSPSNAELVVKVLDGRSLNDHYWVFYSSLSDVEFTLRVTDTATGAVRTYRNRQGNLASAGDTTAFAAARTGAASLESMEEESVLLVEPAANDKGTCAPGPNALCLNNGRFRVELAFRSSGSNGTGRAVPLTGDTGYFWFFSATNVEVIVKVLDGRALNGHFWVFFGGLTDQEYTLTVTDTDTGVRKTYRNQPGNFSSRADTTAIPGR